MGAKLYTNSKGIDVTTHSYSSGDTWKTCNYLYFLDKIQGWKRRDKSAALMFGRAIESAMQFYHENNLKPDSGIDEFKRIWLAHKDNQELKYTDKEVSWSCLYRSGAEMMRLYEIILPSLPIKDPVWQANVKKEVFPGTRLAGIEDQGFLDIISKSPWVHPLLPKVDIPKGASHRPVVIDVKTAGVEIGATPDLLTLDPQLRRYGWLSGIKDLAFLVFVKSKPDSYQKGVEVSLLEDSGKWTAGQKLTIFKFDKEENSALLTHELNLNGIEESLDQHKGKGSGEKKELQIAQWLAEGILEQVSAEKFTKQKLQFIAVRLSDDDVEEAGDAVGKDIAEIVQAGETGKYIRNPGVRFPNAKCTFCSHRGICLKNNELRDKFLVKIESQKVEDDWLDDIDG